MSHFTYVKTQFKNRGALIQALHDIGYSHLEEGSDLPLYGYLGDRRPQTADIVIRRKYLSIASNDIGFKWKGDHYEAIISEYDRQVFPDFIPKVQRRYTYHALLATAAEKGAEKGFTVESESVDEQGQIKIVLGRWA